MPLYEHIYLISVYCDYCLCTFIINRNNQSAMAGETHMVHIIHDIRHVMEYY